MHTLAVLALGISVQVQSQNPQAEISRPELPNFILVIADDVGVDLVAAYGEGSLPACTPTIDGLAARGVGCGCHTAAPFGGWVPGA